jgi:hypothetical protein
LQPFLPLGRQWRIQQSTLQNAGFTARRGHRFTAELGRANLARTSMCLRA